MAAVAGTTSHRARPGRLLRTLSDERLVARVRAGDEGAFEVIYDRHHRALLSFCRHMLGNQQEAEDALQHVYINAYNALRADDRPIQLKAWLFTIARNRCLGMLRGRREHADVDDVQPAVEGLASEVQRREDLREMLADLQRLPEEQRAALVLTELGAHTHEEVGVILGVRTDKVKSLVFQAREHLHGARRARETDCGEIREQLATLTGGALRRTHVRKHLDVCDGCAAFKLEVQRQRAAMSVLLPVVPGAAVKGSVLAAIFGGGAGGGGTGLGGGAVAAGGGAAVAGAGAVATGGGLFAAIGVQGAALKALGALGVLGAASGTGYVAVQEFRTGGTPIASAAQSPDVFASGVTRLAPTAPRSVFASVGRVGPESRGGNEARVFIGGREAVILPFRTHEGVVAVPAPVAGPGAAIVPTLTETPTGTAPTPTDQAPPATAFDVTAAPDEQPPQSQQQAQDDVPVRPDKPRGTRTKKSAGGPGKKRGNGTSKPAARPAPSPSQAQAPSQPGGRPSPSQQQPQPSRPQPAKPQRPKPQRPRPQQQTAAPKPQGQQQRPSQDRPSSKGPAGKKPSKRPAKSPSKPQPAPQQPAAQQPSSAAPGESPSNHGNGNAGGGSTKGDSGNGKGNGTNSGNGNGNGGGNGKGRDRGDG